jgi:hypothetical protein
VQIVDVIWKTVRKATPRYCAQTVSCKNVAAVRLCAFRISNAQKQIVESHFFTMLVADIFYYAIERDNMIV